VPSRVYSFVVRCICGTVSKDPKGKVWSTGASTFIGFDFLLALSGSLFDTRAVLTRTNFETHFLTFCHEFVDVSLNVFAP